MSKSQKNEIKEDNFTNFFNAIYNKNKNYLKTFNLIYDLVQQRVEKEKYCSIESNYTSLFLYEMIKNKVPEKEFNEVIIGIYNISNNQQIENTFNRFFDSVPSKYDFKVDKQDNDKSIWDKMTLVFYTLKNNTICFNKDNEIYLKAIVQNLKEEHLLGFYSSKFNRFIHSFSNDFDQVKEIIKTFIKNPASKKENPKEYSSFIKSLIINISHDSYELSEKKNKKIFNDLNKIIPDFFNCCVEALFSNNKKNNKNIDLELSIINFLYECNFDIIGIINDFYRKTLNKIETSPLTQKTLQDIKRIEKTSDTDKNKKELIAYYKNKVYDELLEQFASSLSISIENKTRLNLHLEDFDYNSSYVKNFVLLCVLSTSCKEKTLHQFPKELFDYVKLLKKENNEEHISFLDFYCDLEAIVQHFEYLFLIKANTKPKNKFKSAKL